MSDAMVRLNADKATSVAISKVCDEFTRLTGIQVQKTFADTSSLIRGLESGSQAELLIVAGEEMASYVKETVGSYFTHTMMDNPDRTITFYLVELIKTKKVRSAELLLIYLLSDRAASTFRSHAFSAYTVLEIGRIPELNPKNP